MSNKIDVEWPKVPGSFDFTPQQQAWFLKIPSGQKYYHKNILLEHNYPYVNIGHVYPIRQQAMRWCVVNLPKGSWIAPLVNVVGYPVSWDDVPIFFADDNLACQFALVWS